MTDDRHAATPAADDPVVELSGGDLQTVAGGLNPQPLPPGYAEE